jgi:hypothetical protein
MSKHILKLVLFSILLLITSSIVAQRGQGNRGQSQNQIQGERELPTFNAENAVGILKYRYKRVLKKTKLKEEKKKSTVAKIISDYNQTINEIKFLHSDELSATENFVAIKRAEAKANRDGGAMHFIQQDAMEKLIHVKHKVHKAKQVLNDQLALVLSEKQFHKWRRIQRARKESLKPQRPDNNGGGRPQKGARRGR